MNILHNKKFKHGSVSLALVVVIIAAVILVNAIFTALATKNLWYIDMTSESIYTLSDDAKTLLANDFDTDKEVLVTFCAEKDVLEATTEQRFALHTILEIAAIYDNVKVRYVDIITNPSAVREYESKTTQKINSQSIIVASGTECRVHSLVSLFALDSSTGSAIGYNGEQKLISSILAVTQDELPVACVTVNHGEEKNSNLSALCEVLYETGYDVQKINLATEDFPESARLVVIFDPQSDFRVADELGDVDELAKLDTFLDANNAAMVFMNYKTPQLERLEQFLQEWGIKIARYDQNLGDGPVPVLVRDLDHSLTTSGNTNVGSYTSATGGLGQSLIEGLKPKANTSVIPKTVAFPMTTAFTVADHYYLRNEEDNNAWSYAYTDNGVTRVCYDVFLSSESAEALVGGYKLTLPDLESIGMQDPAQQPFSYMRVTQETHAKAGESSTYSYLLACASTDFVKPAALDSSYGNRELLTYACSVMGRYVPSVSLSCKYFSSTQITNITSSEANQYTVVLTAVPATIVFVAGVVIMIRRKYA